MSSNSYLPQISSPRGMIKLWGTRGSIPVSGSRFVRHGGNTTCMEFRYGDQLIIFDAGSGIRDAGLALAAEGPRKIHLFITHTHWDHIQGFPFFEPVFLSDFDITVYGPPNLEKDLKSLFVGQLDRSYFPVQMEDLQANLDFVHLPGRSLSIGAIDISWAYTQHPSPTVGYKIGVDGKQVAIVSDNEFLKGYTGSPAAINRDSYQTQGQDNIIEFLRGVDILLHEAQYTCEEYPDKIGWGHTSISNACALVNLTGAKQWIIPHHDPMHDDDFLQRKLSLTRQILRQLGAAIEVTHAFDGMVVYP